MNKRSFHNSEIIESTDRQLSSTGSALGVPGLSEIIVDAIIGHIVDGLDQRTMALSVIVTSVSYIQFI